MKKFIKTGSFKLASGEVSDFYFDIKAALLDGEFFAFLTKKMELLQGKTVAGAGLGGSLMVGCALAAGAKNGLVVRDVVKGHGTCKTVEGDGEKEVILVEDVITTGGSAARAVVELKKSGYSVKEVLCAVNRCGIKDVSGIPITAILDLADVQS